MWREPRMHELDAPPEFIPLINESIYYNSKGRLVGASLATIIQYTLATILVWFFGTSILLVIISTVTDTTFLTGWQVVVSIVLLVISFILFYGWGWKSYEEAWYHFDNSNEIFTVIRRSDNQWETIEIPYEQIEAVEWSGGENGYAIISTVGFEFPTTRADSERFASVTEMWPQLARFDTQMPYWPITLKCFKCEREFGHHIGTAQCPFDQVMLIDPEVKGRIDNEEFHPDDQTRV